MLGDISDEFYGQLKKKESIFVLIANVKDRKKYEYCVRKGLKGTGQAVLLSGNKETNRPST